MVVVATECRARIEHLYRFDAVRESTLEEDPIPAGGRVRCAGAAAGAQDGHSKDQQRNQATAHGHTSDLPTTWIEVRFPASARESEAQRFASGLREVAYSRQPEGGHGKGSHGKSGTSWSHTAGTANGRSGAGNAIRSTLVAVPGAPRLGPARQDALTRGDLLA